MSDQNSSTSGAGAAPRRRGVRTAFGALAVMGGLGYLYYEFEVGSPLQAMVFTSMAKGELGARKVTTPPPAEGPRDIQLCYNLVNGLRTTFREQGNIVSDQQPWLQHSIGSLTVPPVFDRPINPGLRIVDSQGRSMYDATQHTVRPYQNFDEVPPLVAQAFGFVEDQNILDAGKAPSYNPAINVRRTVNAAGEQIGKKLHLRSGASGGSPIPVQVAKMEAWKDARTRTIGDKLGQHLYASIRDYSDGPDTRVRRRKDMVNYLNTVSFAGHPKVGEIFGVREAMAVLWGDTTYDALLKKGEENPETALAFRRVFTLVMAVQMPDRVLHNRPEPVRLAKDGAQAAQPEVVPLSRGGFQVAQERLEKLVPALVKKGDISPHFADMVMQARLDYDSVGKNPALPPASERDKSVDSLRLFVMNSMKLSPQDGLYVLDHCDLTVKSTLDRDLNAAINKRLREFNNPDKAREAGLIGDKLLRPENVSKVVWGITINEVTSGQLPPDRPAGPEPVRGMPDPSQSDLVRPEPAKPPPAGGDVRAIVSTDTFQGALDLNKGGRQNFGSTQKWRMLVTYLEVFSHLHDDLADKDADTLKAMKVHPNDKLTRWAIDYLTDPETDKSKRAMLEAAKDRKYSASPRGFFTSGGMNYPHNFENKGNGSSFTVEEGLWRSMNLVWFGVSEDVREHNKWYGLKINHDIMNAASPDPEVQALRTSYMDRYAQYEGTVFLERAWKRLHGKEPQQIADYVTGKTSRAATPLAAAHFSIQPDADYASLVALLDKQCVAKCPSDAKKMRELFELHAPYRMFDAQGAMEQRFGPEVVGKFAEHPDKAMTDNLARMLTFTPPPAEPSRNWFSPAEQLAALYGWRHPGSSYQETRDFILKHCKDCQKSTDYRDLHKRYESGKYDPAARFYRFDLNDRAYLTKVHPLTIQLARLLRANPEVTWDQAVQATAQDSLFIDKWRRKPNRTEAQRRAILIMTERDALSLVNKQWKDMGYPFTFRAYSLGLCIGVEGDNTASVAAFVSTLLNGGRTVTPTRYAGMIFGQGTPFEMSVQAGHPAEKQVIAPETADLALRIANGGVEQPFGTSRRLYRVFRDAKGEPIETGGKTGTNGESSSIKSATYTRGMYWTGYIGPRLAVTIQAFIPNATSRDNATSAVPTQALKAMAPILQPLLDHTYGYGSAGVAANQPMSPTVVQPKRLDIK